MHYTAMDLTRELLNCGVFSHLPDHDLSRLHYILLHDQPLKNETALRALFHYWYLGDYYCSNIHPRLLQQCNEFLQRFGRPLIDVNAEEFFEA
ncbi:MAG TPA: hypothetical protein VMI35_12050 [Puia sp.]|nr:hypothetical protein [Puia sp.]